ncbi:hypothetical protein WMF27_45835 [Sorangium sp. So ce281]|uniref:hypothetical protein n=1 Tax=unclassified Sorangium TaxID=2621164 RepID=UPI003F5DA682
MSVPLTDVPDGAAALLLLDATDGTGRRRIFDFCIHEAQVFNTAQLFQERQGRMIGSPKLKHALAPIPGFDNCLLQ